MTVDTNIWAWGLGSSGLLGHGSTISRSSPVSVIGGFTNWTAIALSGLGYSTAAVSEDGYVWTWGLNTNGQLGDNSGLPKSSPISVIGGFEDWINVKAGSRHFIALREDGTIWAWGLGTSGQLGSNNRISRSSPVSVVGGITDWEQIGSGLTHSMAKRANGSLWAWGLGTSGQLGNNRFSRSSPVSVLGGITDWVDFDGGNAWSLGLRENGTLWAWGSGNSGRTGLNTTFNRSSPVVVVGGFTDWATCSCGNYSGANVRGDGILWTWGSNTAGVLGTGNVIVRSSPVSVLGGFTDWVAASIGLDTAVGFRSDGSLWAWGVSQHGKLGNNTAFPNRSSPVSVAHGDLDLWQQVRVGRQHVVVLRGILPDVIGPEPEPEPEPYVPLNYFPIIANSTDLEIQELPEGSDLDLQGSNIVYAETINGQDISTLSDETLKLNIHTLENVLDIVKELRGVNFSWIDSNRESMGMIAQEVEKVLPHLVYENDKGEKAIAYSNLIPVLIEAIKENSKTLSEIEHRLHKYNNDQ